MHGHPMVLGCVEELLGGGGVPFDGIYFLNLYYSSTFRPCGASVFSLSIQKDSRLRMMGRSLFRMDSMPMMLRSLMLWSGML